MNEMNKIKTNSVVRAPQGTRTKTQGTRTFGNGPAQIQRPCTTKNELSPEKKYMYMCGQCTITTSNGPAQKPNGTAQ